MVFLCGDVVWADLDPSLGHEQAKRRPLVVVSNDSFNLRCSLTMVVPITSADSGYPLHLDVGWVPTEGGGRAVAGFAEAEQLKSLDLRARNAVKVGRLDEATLGDLIDLVIGCLVGPDTMIVSASSAARDTGGHQ